MPLRPFLLLVAMLYAIPLLFGQQKTGRQTPYTIPKKATVDPKAARNEWMPVLQSLEMPDPVPGSDKARLRVIKEASRKRFPYRPRAKSATLKQGHTPAQAPAIGMNFEGNPFTVSVPNDNTLAVSNGGMLLSSINTTIYMFDLSLDSLVMDITLEAFAHPIDSLNNKFDPKALYDPIRDRFILVYLGGNSAAVTGIIVCFSATSDPTGAWHLFEIPGNPFGDNTWSDYPAISISPEELFITINLVREGEPWQTGFSQTLIWQIEKEGGYEGDTAITTVMWSDIMDDSTNIRNMHPVKGGSYPYGPNAYFLSNKNFSMLSDTIYLMEITNTIASGEAELLVTRGHSSTAYGVPPNAKQANNHFFQTNDARVLGGLLEQGRIQFVSNTVDTSNGFAAVYHGFIDSLTTNPQFSGHIIGDTLLEFGYPNISYSGRHPCDQETIISFDHTAGDVFAGMSAIYYGNDRNYSDVFRLKDGAGFVDIQFGAVQRWGDYTGSQRKYDEPGTVWVSGTWGSANRENRTWISELISWDTTVMTIQMTDSLDLSAFRADDGLAVVEAQGGNPPYTYSWDDPLAQQGDTARNLPAGNYSVWVTDSFGCRQYTKVSLSEPAPVAQNLPHASLFPNPAATYSSIKFYLEEDSEITIGLYDMSGGLVTELMNRPANKGYNLFSFSTTPLARGNYIIVVRSPDGLVFSQKLSK